MKIKTLAIIHSFPRYALFTVCSMALAMTADCAEPATEKDADGWVALFNGRDLEGWHVNTGNGGDEASLTAEDIFTVEGGVIHVYAGAAAGSKQYNANLHHESVWGKFHLQVEYRWLEKKFDPRTEATRDAGILFHIHTKPDAVWPPSLEMQLGAGKPGDQYVTGDLFVLGTTRAESSAQKMNYDPGSRPVTRGEAATGRRTAVTKHAERPIGEWNTADVIVNGSQKAQFYVNGTLVNTVSNMQYKDEKGGWKPLEKGHVSVQAEWAELEYRVIRIKELK